VRLRMGLLTPSAKSSFEDLFWTWFEIVTKGPRQFFIELKKNGTPNTTSNNKEFELATPFEFFIFMFVVCVILLHYSYIINTKFLSDSVAIKLNISKDYVGVVAIQTFLAFILIGIQCLIYTILANFSFIGGKVTLQKIVQTKFYLYAYAVIPYLVNIFLSWAIAKTVGQIKCPIDDQLKIWYFITPFISLSFWIIMVVIDIVAISAVSSARPIRLFIIYAPISLLLLIIVSYVKLY
jgi:hypothetical protein